MRSDRGNVIVEFVGVTIGMLLPVVFVASGCWSVAQAHLALRDASVSSVRGFVLAETETQGFSRMNAIVSDVVSGFGINAEQVQRVVRCSNSNCVAGGTHVTVKLNYVVKFALPLYGNFNIPISDSHTEQVDEVR